MAIQKPSQTFTKIHLKKLHTLFKQFVFTVSFTVLINISGYSQDVPPRIQTINPNVEKDTTIVKNDSIPEIGEALKETDTIVADSIPKKKGLLSSIVNYSATDYTAINQKTKTITLYNDAKVSYEDMEITSGIIIIDYEKNLVYAGRLKDTSGEYSQHPVFKQGANVIEPDSIIFNTDSKKALVFNSRTEQSEFNVFAPKTKKENDSVYFLEKGRFTTSENLDDPEYEFIASKIKLVPDKKIVVGSTNMEIYGVPTPIWLPFAFFPLTNKQTSGILLPSFGEDTANDRGYNLQNLGYYFAISDYADLAILADYYTNGSYGLKAESNYAWRYKFRGSFGFRYEKIVSSERGFPDYSQSTLYNIRWSHSQDAKSNPNSRFSASVNLGSSRYYQQSISQANLSNVLNNTLSSSVSYSRTFQGEPQVNINLTATHQQNTNTQIINMTLPTFQGSVSRIFPFAPKVGSKKGLFQNINLQYNVRAENRIQTTDSLFFKSEMFQDARVGARHSIPISTNFKVFKYFSVSAGANYEENWTLNPIRKYWDPVEEEVVTEELNEFDSFRTYNFSTSVGTTIYGMFNFKRDDNDPKIHAIRHVIRPSISYNINPAFDQYYDTYTIIDANGTTLEDYTRFEQSIFGTPTQNFSSSMGISVGNNIEAKVRSKDSTSVEPEKITILNNLNFSTAYNFAADSLRISPIRMSGGTQILKKKMSINFGATLDPYALDNNNRRIDKLNINNGGSLFRMTSASLNMSYSLNNNSFKKSGDDDMSEEAIEESVQSGGRADDLFGDPLDITGQSFKNKDKDDETKSEFYNYAIPWNLRIAYALNYSNNARQNQISSHSLMFSGDVELSPNWRVGVSSGYDLVNKGFTFTTLNFERDLMSWRMSFRWVPFGTYGQWNFFIGISSQFLKDLKYDKRRERDQQL
ncbi:putative LPS assembly protein LptD [Aegicerativicinus sediminis]|uniref:putative LPS assembly protein LptD n=1 Tax=Aegicerativicinus sediminis TaxID=2893202 RepID=UPI001E4E89D3|nr:putative LPS assembly protein LptD [Aegicerativicinus sediminis]